jgi:predicted amidohydrolase YtcJ
VALELAGLDANTPDPDLGIIERDPDGTPSGTLRESAQRLVASLVPQPTAAERMTGLLRGVEVLNGFGVTSIIEARASAEDLELYHRAEAAGDLDVRVVASRSLDRDDVEGQIRDIEAAEPNDADSATDASAALVHSRAVKIFLDGVLEGETAALLEPYLTSTPTTRNTPRGRLSMEPAVLERIVTALDAAGVQVHVHAIGDWAVKTALDAFSAARRANGPSDSRHHIAHLQLVDPADYERFAALGVAANFQAVWAFPDDYIVNINLPQVGPERVARMYPIGSLARAGARIVAGSDWNVTTANPLLAIEVAVTRQDPSGRRTDVLNATEAVDLETMLRAYTVNGAWLMHQEHETGMLAPGFAADFVMLERNLFEIPASEIGEVKVLATYLAGRAVFDAAE